MVLQYQNICFGFSNTLIIKRKIIDYYEILGF